jgi:glucose/arabinose dehydrogenase
MRRAFTLAMVAAVLTTLPPLGGSPALAGERVRVIDCRASNPQCWPTAFAFTPNGDHVFYVERFTGQIRRHTLANNHDVQWADIDNVATSGEQGVLGVALDPRWSQDPDLRWVYVFYTHQSPQQNRILRLRKTNSGGLNRDRLLTIAGAASGYHNGGPIHIGPDGKLWAVTGEDHDAPRAQDTDDPAGKVLRMNLNGNRPGDNPIAGSKAYSYGHRNSFGFAFDPETDEPWQTENGPACKDEINHILPGENYGWGGASNCPDTSNSGPSPMGPEIFYTPTIAPTGAAFCDGCGLGPAVEGDLLFGAFNDGKIRRLVLNAGRDGVVEDFVVYTNADGVVAVEAAPNGRIHFSDPNGIYRLTQG